MDQERKTADPTFSAEQVSEIIETATRLQHLTDEQHRTSELTMDQLAEIGAELGITPEALARAISTEDRQARSDRNASARKAQWYRHVGTYLIVISGLAAIDWFSDGVISFFFYPAIGWGMGVAIHALSAFSRD